MLFILGTITGLIIATLIAVLLFVFKTDTTNIITSVKRNIPGKQGSFIETETLPEHINNLLK